VFHACFFQARFVVFYSEALIGVVLSRRWIGALRQTCTQVIDTVAHHLISPVRTHLSATLAICSFMKKSKFTVCDYMTQGCKDRQQKIITTKGNRSHAACFQGKPTYLLSRQVGSNPCHLLSRQVTCLLHQWCYSILVEGLKCESEVG